MLLIFHFSVLFLLIVGHGEGFSSTSTIALISEVRVREKQWNHRANNIISFYSRPSKGRDVPPAFSIDSDDDEDTYIPPQFTIDDDDDDDNDGKEYRPKATTTIKLKKRPVIRATRKNTNIGNDNDSYGNEDDDEDDDGYSENIVSTRSRRPKRPRQETKMTFTSWMEKNEKFTTQNQNELPTPAQQQQQRRQPTKMRRDSYADDDGDDDATTDRPFARNGISSSSSSQTKTFRQDFRGTRVFVQGIPTGVSWQDLKDHFRVAGEVVFASVSVDPTTGASKGHGIVQFETTEMAQNAINIMRNHPLDGSQLFVREDYQDEKENSRLRTVSPSRGSAPPTIWKCANEDNVEYMDENEVATIKALIKARDDARKRKKYDVSDKIRDELKEVHGVFIDDRLKMWWTSIDGNKVPQSIQDINGDGRWKLKPWRQIPTTPENDLCVDPNLVEALLKQRDIARREKDFRTADALLKQARTAPDGGLELRIHDESRTWRIWTEAPPPKAVEHKISSDPIEAREDAAKRCIAIVEEYAPEKRDEMVTLLEKFPGREFQMLKRLEKQYL